MNYFPKFLIALAIANFSMSFMAGTLNTVDINICQNVFSKLPSELQKPDCFSGNLIGCKVQVVAGIVYEIKLENVAGLDSIVHIHKNFDGVYSIEVIEDASVTN